jgi:hypothetical protein
MTMVSSIVDPGSTVHVRLHMMRKTARTSLDYQMAMD